jgi:hypothetical protein
MNNDNKYSAEEYLEKNYNYYDTKAILYKKIYTILIIADITISAFITFATLFIDISFSVKYIIAFMSSIITIISSLRVTFGFQKNWIEYRTTAEILKYHQYLYTTKSAPYDGENRESILISNVYSNVKTENKNWRSSSLSNKKTDSAK